VDDPIGAVVKNLVDLQRVANGFNREAQGLLAELRDEVAALMAKRDPASVLPRYRAGRIKKLLSELREIVGPTYDEVFRLTRDNLKELGAFQATWAADQLTRTVGRDALRSIGVEISKQGVGRNFFASVIREQPIRGKLLNAWFKEESENTVRRVEQQVRLGLAQNETIDQLIRRIRGRSNGRGGFRGGVMATNSRNAETIVRTATNHVSNAAHLETYKQNADVLTKVRYTATLDSRTSDICISLDGREWDIDADDIATPPLHPNCRSVLTPVVDWKGLGLTPPEEGTRASADGQVPSSTTYEQWLRGQPRAVQDKVLGPGKAQLWRDGKIKSLRELVKRDRTVRTVKELAERAPSRNLLKMRSFGASDNFVGRVRSAADDLPAVVQKRLADSGVRTRVGARLRDTGIDLPDFHAGGYDPANQTINIAEFTTGGVRTQAAAGVFRHEAGHAWDDVLGRNRFARRSDELDFLEAWETGRSRARAMKASELSYYINERSGPSEAFAEGSAIVWGGGGTPFFEQKFRQAFPELLELLRKLT
jgi:SPP1 gp7 family putative phage head morphogenesis protein